MTGQTDRLIIEIVRCAVSKVKLSIYTEEVARSPGNLNDREDIDFIDRRIVSSR